MKYLVISDIHGSLSGVSFIEEALKMHQTNRILALGDFLYHGPRNNLPIDYAVKDVIAVLNSYSTRITAVRGNCDAEVDQMVLDFPLTADYNILNIADRSIFMTHGHIYSLDHMPKLAAEDCFLYGHTHIPQAEKTNGIYLLNPGSVSIPKGGHPASYAVLDEKSFTIYTLDHNIYMTLQFD